MSANAPISHKITLAGCSFNVRIPAEEREHYDRIARYAQSVFDEVRGQGGDGAQTLAMTAFQIAIELFEAQQDLDETRDGERRIKKVIERIDAALPPG